MLNTAHAMKRVNERGPRWAVVGHIRRGELDVIYTVTADTAEEIRERWVERGRYQVQVHPPVDGINLSKLGEERTAAKRVLDDATEKLRAAVIAAVNDDGRAEAEVARQAGVDRMTVRGWLGK